MRNKHSRASLFLMEMIVTILFFSLASTVCLQCFVRAHEIGINTTELNHAVAIAQGYAEVMRGTDGSIDSIMKVYPDTQSVDSTTYIAYYDLKFNRCAAEDASYLANIILTPDDTIQNMDISIKRLSDDSIIYELKATKYIKHYSRG